MNTETTLINELLKEFAADSSWIVTPPDASLPWLPDVLLRGPQRQLVAIEVKGGVDQLHFEVLASLEAIVPRLENRYRATVTAILVTERRISPRLRAAVAGSSVLLVPYEASSTSSAVAEIKELCRALEENSDSPDTAMQEFPVLTKELAKLHNAANTAFQRGNFAQANKMLVPLIQRQREVLGEDHPRTLQALLQYSRGLYRLGRLEDARQELGVLLTRLNDVLGPDHPQTLIAEGLYGNVLLRLGVLAEAIMVLRAAAEKQSTTFGPDAGPTIATQAALATALSRVEQHDEAVALLRRVLSTQEQSDASEYRLMQSRTSLAMALSSSGSHDEALQLLDRIRSEQSGTVDIKLLESQTAIVMARAGLGEWDEALAALEAVDQMRFSDILRIYTQEVLRNQSTGHS